MRRISLFLLLGLCLPVFSQDDAKEDREIFSCHFNDIYIRMSLREKRYFAVFQLPDSMNKKVVLPWLKIMKKVREAQGYREIGQTVRFLPFKMPLRTPFRPLVYNKLALRDWNMQGSVGFEILSCVFVAPRETIRDVLWELRGDSKNGTATITLSLDPFAKEDKIHCFLPLMEGDKKKVENFLVVTLGRRSAIHTDTVSFGLTSHKIPQGLPSENILDRKQTVGGGIMEMATDHLAEKRAFDPVYLVLEGYLTASGTTNKEESLLLIPADGSSDSSATSNDGGNPIVLPPVFDFTIPPLGTSDN